MENILEIVEQLLSPVLSIAAVIISLCKRKHVSSTKSMEDILNEGKERYEKYVNKQCKKNNIELKEKTNNGEEIQN